MGTEEILNGIWAAANKTAKAAISSMNSTKHMEKLEEKEVDLERQMVNLQWWNNVLEVSCIFSISSFIILTA